VIKRIHWRLNLEILQVVPNLEFVLVLMDLWEGGCEVGSTIPPSPPNLSRGLYPMVYIQVHYSRIE